MPRPRNPNPPNRQACDRCHAQKLRCQHQGAEGACIRCSRNNTPCIFSPRQRRAVAAQTVGQDVPNRPCDASPSIGQIAEGDQGDQINSGDDGGDIDRTTMLQPQEQHHGKDPTRIQNYVPDAETLLSDTGNADVADWMSPSGSIESPTRLLSDWAGGGNLLDMFSTGFVGDCNLNLDFTNMNSGWNFPVSGQQELSEESLTQRSHHNPDIDSGSQTKGSTLDSSSINDAFSSVSYVRQLADLNVRLFEHAEKLPPVSTVITDRTPGLDGRVFAIDETFRMTQTLIDVLKRLYPHSFNTAPPADFVPDQGTVLLIMSCSNRVFDIYEIIFSHMRGCIKHRITPVGKDGKTILLPQLRIGSFVPPTPSAIVMQMLLIILMAAELFDQLQDVLGVWRWHGTERSQAGSDKTNRGAGPVEASHGHFEELELTVGTRLRFPDFTEEAKAKMAERASALAGKIVDTRQLLLTLPGIRGEGSIQQFLS